MIQRFNRPGFTLLEVIVVIAMIAIMATLVGVSPMRPGGNGEREPDAERAVSVARAAAIESGRPVQALIDVAGDSAFVLALPDGSVIADSIMPIERLTGRAR